MRDIIFRSVTYSQLNDYAARQLTDLNWENLRSRHLILKEDILNIMKKMKERNMGEWTHYDDLLVTNIWRMQACRRFKVRRIGCVFDYSVHTSNEIISMFTNYGKKIVDLSMPVMSQKFVDYFKRNISGDHRFRIFRALEHRGRSEKEFVIKEYGMDWDNDGINYYETIEKYPILKILPDVMMVYINNIIGNRWCPVNKLFNANQKIINDSMVKIDDRRQTTEKDYKAIYDAVMIYMTSEFIFQLYGEIICNCPDTEPYSYRVLVLNYIMKVTGGIPLPGKPEHVTSWIHDIFDPCLNIIKKKNNTLLPFCKDMETVTTLGSFGDVRRVQQGYSQDSLLIALDISKEKENTLDYIWGMILKNQMSENIPETAIFSSNKMIGENKNDS